MVMLDYTFPIFALQKESFNSSLRSPVELGEEKVRAV
jgi:hypothetical protein